MLSAENIPTNEKSVIEDFTTAQYREILRIAKRNYKFALYGRDKMPEPFILWRHDCDASLNRAFRIAEIERQEGVESTYFINIHSEFYNPFEKTQAGLIGQILAFGHELGLHFDPNFYGTDCEEELEKQIASEAELLKKHFGAKLSAFSFHNPSKSILECDRESYGGLMNCYSKRFKNEVSYCSDANGYWRFRRLRDVVEQAKEPCVQVLTHPEWWQETPMPPRQRICRCAYGRAAASIHFYDSAISNCGRQNKAGEFESFNFLGKAEPRLFELCDYLWNNGYYSTLFIEIWRLHEALLSSICKAACREKSDARSKEPAESSAQSAYSSNTPKIFSELFGQSWEKTAGIEEKTHEYWNTVRNGTLLGLNPIPEQSYIDGCTHVCHAIVALASWANNCGISYNISISKLH